MTKKQAKTQKHVPGTYATKPNREQRRHPQAQPHDQPLARDADAQEADVPDVPARNRGHRE